MNPRKQQILDALASRGTMSVDELVKCCGVSEMTIRRDLSALETMGKVERTWGGARIAQRQAMEFSHRKRAEHHSEEKGRIGEYAARLVKPGTYVFLDAGTTTIRIAERIRQVKGVTVLTCSFAVVAELFDVADVSVIMLGGEVQSATMEAYGPLTEKNFQWVSADLAFVGAEAVDGDGGLYANNMESARVTELILQVSKQKVLVADSGKWDLSAPVKYGTLESVDTVITDSGLRPEMRSAVEKRGVELVLV